jgi:Zn-dependent protease with chaperone function
VSADLLLSCLWRAIVEVPEPSEAAIRFYRSGRWIWIAATLWSILIPWLIHRSGVGRRWQGWVERARVPKTLVPCGVFALFTSLTFALDLPWAYGVGYARAHAYGLSVQTPVKWTRDLLTSFAIELVLGMAAAWVLFFLLRRLPRTWWAALAALTVPVGAALVYLAPLVIDPLFNDFRPLENVALQRQILELTERAGLDESRIFEVRKSVDTTAVNAYVTGFAGSHRVVLWDTLLAKLEEREILAVVAHEAGHYVLGHVALGIALSGLGALAILFLVDRLVRRLVPDPTARLQPASLPTWVLAVSLVSLLGQPLGLAVSRHLEHQADRFALDLTRDNDAVAGAFTKLQLNNLSYPRPDTWVVWLRSSHPPLAERIDFANRYTPGR